MQGSLLLLVDRSNGQLTITGQGAILRQINKDGTHFLCKMFRKGYSVNEVVSVEKLESCLLFDTSKDLDAFFAENSPPPKALEHEAAAPAPKPGLSLVEPSDSPIELFPDL